MYTQEDSKIRTYQSSPYRGECHGGHRETKISTKFNLKTHVFLNLPLFTHKQRVSNNWYCQVHTDTSKRQKTTPLHTPYIHTHDPPQNDLSNTQIPNQPLHTQKRAFSRHSSHTHINEQQVPPPATQTPNTSTKTHPSNILNKRIWGQRIGAYLALGPQVGPVVHQCPGDLLMTLTARLVERHITELMRERW